MRNIKASKVRRIINIERLYGENSYLKSIGYL